MCHYNEITMTDLTANPIIEFSIQFVIVFIDKKQNRPR